MSSEKRAGRPVEIADETVQISVRVSVEDARFLDKAAALTGLRGRAAVMRDALREYRERHKGEAGCEGLLVPATRPKRNLLLLGEAEDEREELECAEKIASAVRELAWGVDS